MIKKHLAIITLIAVTTPLLSMLGISVAANQLSTLFTVNSIMFSIGLGLIAGFKITGVKNRTYIAEIRHNVKEVRNVFIILFSLSALSFMISPLNERPLTLSLHGYTFSLDLLLLSALVVVYSTIYFIRNFLAIQKLNDDIFDRLLEEG